MDIRVLGSLRVANDGRLVDIKRRRERCLLGVLLLEANRGVPLDRLLELLWDGAPPSNARASLRTHISRLRSSLRQCDGGIVLSRTGDGYAAQLDATAVDAWRFRIFVDEARVARNLGERAHLLRSALAQWRGPVLGDAASAMVRARIGAPWEEARLSVVEAVIDADLARGHHSNVIGELTALGAEHPYHERFASQLMVALYRCGRQADALEVFNRLDRRLRDDVGIGAGQDIAALHQRILRSEATLSGVPTVPAWPAVEDPGGGTWSADPGGPSVGRADRHRGRA